MAKVPQRLFLERRSYRMRRFVDAARLLPILGVALLCIPMLWSKEGDGATGTSFAMIYIFGVWAFLALCAGLLARVLPDEGPDDPPEPLTPPLTPLIDGEGGRD